MPMYRRAQSGLGAAIAIFQGAVVEFLTGADVAISAEELNV